MDSPGNIFNSRTVFLAAGARVDLRGVMKFALLIAATNTAKVSISFDGGTFTPFPPGISLEGFESDQLWIQNDDAVQNIITIAYGSATVRDNRFILDALTVLQTQTQNLPASVAAGLDVSNASTLRVVAARPGAFSSVESSATTNATSVTAAATTLKNIHAFNTSGAVKFLRLYNRAAAPIVGTDVADLVFAIPASGHIHIDFQSGEYFAVGLAYAITGAAAYNDATAVAAHDVHLTLSIL